MKSLSSLPLNIMSIPRITASSMRYLNNGAVKKLVGAVVLNSDSFYY